MKHTHICAALLVFSLLLATIAAAQSVPPVVELSQNVKIVDTIYDDIWPDMDGDRVVFTRVYVRGDIYTTETMLYNLTTKVETRLSNNAHEDTRPKIHGNYVVWEGRTASGFTWAINYYNFALGTTGYIHIPTALDHYRPQVYGNHVVFGTTGADAAAKGIWVYSFTNSTYWKINGLGSTDRPGASIWGNTVLYHTLGSSLYTYDIPSGVTTTILTDTNWTFYLTCNMQGDVFAATGMQIQILSQAYRPFVLVGWLSNATMQNFTFDMSNPLGSQRNWHGHVGDRFVTYSENGGWYTGMPAHSRLIQPSDLTDPHDVYVWDSWTGAHYPVSNSAAYNELTPVIHGNSVVYIADDDGTFGIWLWSVQTSTPTQPDAENGNGADDDTGGTPPIYLFGIIAIVVAAVLVAAIAYQAHQKLDETAPRQKRGKRG